MKYAFALLVSLFLLGGSPTHADETDMAWTRVTESSWVLDLSKKGEGIIVLIHRANGDIFFTSLVECKDKKVTQKHSWKYGEKNAHGTDCKGENLQTPTEKWEAYILTFPVKDPPKRTSPKYSYNLIAHTPGFRAFFMTLTKCLSCVPS